MHRFNSFNYFINKFVWGLISTLAQSLRAYCSKEQENWSRILPSVMMAFRMSPTQSTQFSPYYMLFGKEMPLPIDTKSLQSMETIFERKFCPLSDTRLLQAPYLVKISL
jgi:hypothetical protein